MQASNVVLALMFMGISDGTTPPIGFWPMDSNSMTKDVSGNGNNGVGYGLQLAIGPSGVKDTALQFAGDANSYMTINNSALDVGAAGSFSYTGFIYTDKHDGCFWEWWEIGRPPPTYIWSWENKELLVNFLSRSNNDNVNVRPMFPIEYNKWLFIGVSYDVKNWKITVKMNDNVKQFDITKRNLAFTSSALIHVGKRPGTDSTALRSYFSGRMSCIMLHKVALSPEEMEKAEKYCLNKATGDTLSSWYKLFQKDGNIPVGHQLSEVQAIGNVDCLITCSKTVDCVSVSYSTTGKCRLSNVNFFLGAVTSAAEVGSHVYSRDFTIPLF